MGDEFQYFKTIYYTPVAGDLLYYSIVCECLCVSSVRCE